MVAKQKSTRNAKIPEYIKKSTRESIATGKGDISMNIIVDIEIVIDKLQRKFLWKDPQAERREVCVSEGMAD